MDIHSSGEDEGPEYQRRPRKAQRRLSPVPAPSAAPAASAKQRSKGKAHPPSPSPSEQVAGASSVHIAPPEENKSDAEDNDHEDIAVGKVYALDHLYRCSHH